MSEDSGYKKMHMFDAFGDWWERVNLGTIKQNCWEYTSVVIGEVEVLHLQDEDLKDK